jgi:hypothetical protein
MQPLSLPPLSLLKLQPLAILSSLPWWALSTDLPAQVRPPLFWWAIPSKKVTRKGNSVKKIR